MLAFAIRRLLGMVLVLFVVSFFVFLVFIVIPGGDPAVRIAGRTANDQNIENIRQTWGFNEPFYVQYVDMMKKAGNGLRPGCCEGQQSELRSQTNQLNVVDQIKAGIPATFSLADRGGDHLAVLRGRRRHHLRDYRRPLVGSRRSHCSR